MIINIPQEICNYIELLQYETDSRKHLLAFMKKIDVNENEYNKLFKEYINYYIQLNEAKQYLENTYLKPELKTNNFSWKLQFNTGECEIKINDE